jgi:alanyl-tRNA synthetase
LREETSVEAKIKDVLKVEGKKALVTLYENPFRPAGGGQPGDTGTLEGTNLLAVVTDCTEEDAGPVLHLTVKRGEVRPGDVVMVKVDYGRHTMLSRMHTGEHILSRALERQVPGLRVYKVSIDPKESSIYLRYDGELTWEMLFSAEDEANSIIASDMPVKIYSLSPQEAQSLPNLKANWERIESEEIRIVQIGDYDLIACSGSHVSSTAQVGGVIVTAFRGSPPEWEVKFSLERAHLLDDYGRVMRKLLRKVGCKPEDLEPIYDRLKEEKESLQKLLGKVRSYISFPFSEEQVDGYELLSAEAPGLTVEVATPALKKLTEERKKAVVVLLIQVGEEREAYFVLTAGNDVAVDLRKIVKDRKELEAKGGGSASWVSGVTTCLSVARWKEALSELLRSA